MKFFKHTLPIKTERLPALQLGELKNLNKMNTIITLFNHSFGGLSPPKAARV